MVLVYVLDVSHKLLLELIEEQLVQVSVLVLEHFADCPAHAGGGGCVAFFSVVDGGTGTAIGLDGESICHLKIPPVDMAS